MVAIGGALRLVARPVINSVARGVGARLLGGGARAGGRAAASGTGLGVPLLGGAGGALPSAGGAGMAGIALASGTAVGLSIAGDPIADDIAGYLRGATSRSGGSTRNRGTVLPGGGGGGGGSEQIEPLPGPTPEDDWRDTLTPRSPTRRPDPPVPEPGETEVPQPGGQPQPNRKKYKWHSAYPEEVKDDDDDRKRKSGSGINFKRRKVYLPRYVRLN